MSAAQSRRRGARIALIAGLALAVVVLTMALAIVLPMVTHHSAGGSGQAIPEAIVADSRATGADGRIRELRAENKEGSLADLSELVPGERLIVRGSGFDARVGIYVAICAIPESPGEKPSPCLGGIPDTAGDEAPDVDQPAASAWVTDDWAWRAFATHGYGEEGSFEVALTVPSPISGELDCREVRCAIATRADHTAASDRVQDMLLPVRFAE